MKSREDSQNVSRLDRQIKGTTSEEQPLNGLTGGHHYATSQQRPPVHLESMQEFGPSGNQNPSRSKAHSFRRNIKIQPQP
jgi:hypothetical protein